jgi:hypothetical protein
MWCGASVESCAVDSKSFGESTLVGMNQVHEQPIGGPQQ